MQSTTSSYPATFTFDPPEKVANWRPLVHWILAIPHMAVLWALGVVSEILWVISIFAILFTGKLPEGFANFQTMYMRYSLRTFSYVGFMREEYPPFSFGMSTSDPGDDPRVRFDVRAELEGRNRLTSFFRFILVIPHLIWAALLFVASFFVFLIAFFAVLFTGKWPEGMRTFAIKVWAYWNRVQTYLLLLTDQYPPFALA